MKNLGRVQLRWISIWFGSEWEEQGGKKELSPDYWMTDITISYGSWCYTNGQTYKAPDLVIRNMIDVWSKKGIVLLNISPKADGIIPQEQRDVLLATGEWIEKHKEAIYETRVYSIYGYGKAKIDDGEFGGQSATIQYNEHDVRFLLSKDKKSLYVFTLGLPEANSTLEINHINRSGIRKVSVLGSGVEVKFSLSNEVLKLETPTASAMDRIATVFKIEFE